MTKLTGCVFLCLGLFLAADNAKVDSLDHGHASLVPVPDHSSSDKGRVDAKHSHQSSWMDRFDAALRRLILPETVKIIDAFDAGHEIEAGDLEGLRLKRESENDVKMKGVSSENDEKRSAGEEKMAEVKKEKTKEKTKEINDKEDKDKEVREEKRVEEKNENVGKEQLEKRKTRQNILYTEEEDDDDEFDTGNLKRSRFSDSKTDSKPYRSAEGVSYLEIKNDEAGNVEDEEQNDEIENLMRQRNFKLRQARNNEDRQHKEHRKRRRHNNANGGKFPRRRHRNEAGDKHSYRRRRYYDLVNPFHIEGEDSSMRRAYRDDALDGYDLRQRDRRHGDRKSTSRNRRRPDDEDVDENDAAMLRLDDRGYERLLRRSRNSETEDGEDSDNMRNARGLKDMYYDVGTLLFDDEDASSEDEQRRSVRLSGSDDEEDVGKDDERMKRGWAADDEVAEERRRRSQEDEDDEENRLMKRSAVDGNAEGRGVDRQRQAKNDDGFYEQELPREVINGRGKRRRVWETVKRRPFEY